MNAATAYFRAFIDGGLDSFTTHAILIGVIAAAEISLGIGIWLESPKDKGLREWIGLYTVLGGCVVSVIATVLLLVFDEGISRNQNARIDAQQSIIGAQNDKIIALETKIAPRSLSDDSQRELARELWKYGQTPWDLSVTPDAELSFTLQIINVLRRANWRHLAWAATSVQVPSPEIPSLDVRPDDPNQAHAVVIGGLGGVEVLYPPDGPERLKEAAEALAAGLQDATIQATAAPIPAAALLDVLRPDEVHVRIGSRL